MSRTTVAFTGEQKEKIEKAVIKVILETKEQVRFSEIVHTCISKYLDEAVEDILDERAKRK